MGLYKNEAKAIFEAISKEEVYKAHKKSIVIVGDCTSGKSSIVRELLKNFEDNNNIYFIDSVNRNVMPLSDNDVDSINYSGQKPSEILKARSDSKVIGMKDVFPKGIYGGTVTYFELIRLFNQKYRDLAKKYIGKELILVEEELESCSNNFAEQSADSVLISEIKERMSTTKKILVNEGNDLSSLSSSESCILRMVMEISYASEMECKTVVIDELDSHLDSKTLGEFVGMITEDYPHIRFILVTHRVSDLLEFHEMDALVLVKTADCIESSKVDCDDYSEIGHIDRIREQVTRKRREGILLEECVELVVNGEGIPEQLMVSIEGFEKERLTTREKVLLAYIKRWSNNGDRITN